MPKEDKGKKGSRPKKAQPKPSAPLAGKKSATVPKRTLDKKPALPAAVVARPVAPTPVAAPIARPKPKPAPIAPPKPKPSPPRFVKPAPAPPRAMVSNNSTVTVVVFALGIIAAAIVIFFAVRFQASRTTPTNNLNAVAVQDQTLADVMATSTFPTWISTWKTVDPYVSDSEFTLESQSAISLAQPTAAATTPIPVALRAPLANRYVWSPDKSRFVDYLANYGEPDSSVIVYNRDGSGRLEALAFCGTGCSFTGAVWLDGDRVAVFGVADELKSDGTPLCIRNQGSVGDTTQRCYRHLTLTVYDFATDQQRTYRSEKHDFATNPLETDMRTRWLSGMSTEDQAAVGNSQEATVIRGEVMSWDGASGIVSIKDDAGQLHFAAVSPSALIRSQENAPITIDDTVRSRVEVAAVTNGQGAMTVLSVRVLQGPSLTLTDPATGSYVGRRFTVQGSELPNVGDVEIRITDQAQKTSVFHRSVHPDATGASFSTNVDLAGKGVVKGDTLVISVYTASMPFTTAGSPPETSVAVQYRP